MEEDRIHSIPILDLNPGEICVESPRRLARGTNINHGAQSSLAPRSANRCGGKVVLGRADVPPWAVRASRACKRECVHACIRDRPATKADRPHAAALPRFRPFRYVDTTRDSL